ncbi:MAG: HPr-rel-A system PqqD family peptide chaperone [Alphaproteobacteria bacterium]
MTETGNFGAERPMSERARWRLPEGVRLVWRAWDDEFVVFNTLSGQTHLLDGVSAAILDALERGPATVDELSRRLAERFDLAIDEALRSRITTICGRFDNLGLADPDSP